MFPQRFFPGRYFAARYFPKTGGSAPSVTVIALIRFVPASRIIQITPR